MALAAMGPSRARVPGADRVIVHAKDVTGWLLSDRKRKSWKPLGYRLDGEQLRSDLIDGIAGPHEILNVIPSIAGAKEWEIRFPLTGPNGKTCLVRAYLIAEVRGAAPRLYSTCVEC